ncbi:isochorismatase domain-containing protein 1-like [Condylostylus longicornis]|uniref:isochorismatase domain-containing protein 1-like n=1 Tax=Condylostylus longicornis TaxID=2530218 RepID=UPI00244DFF66|nr:isochorismatase domain-containing protein 1-like [Condylostylus longicornis]
MAARFAKLDLKNTSFLLCDIQTKFRPSMKFFDPFVVNSNKLVKAGKILNVPLLATEHYPKALGHIVDEIDVSHAKCVLPKTKFSMYIPELEKNLKEIGNVKNIVLFGLEAHICVEQTTLDLLENGYNVHLVADCVMSRILQDRDLAIERMRQYGCFITTSESVIFSLMVDKNHEKFKECSALVREPSVDVGLAKK